MKVYCAWCQLLMGETPHRDPPSSHGICQHCAPHLEAGTAPPSCVECGQLWARQGSEFCGRCARAHERDLAYDRERALNCESCGRPIANHYDEAGWLPCFESIAETIIYHETQGDA